MTRDESATRARADRAFAVYGQFPSYRAILDREGVETPTDVSLSAAKSSYATA